MRTWKRAPRDRKCGYCRSAIRRGEPMYVAAVAVLQAPKIRCQTCAGPAPADLPPLVDPAPIDPTPLVHIASGPNTLPFDFKRASAVEREPGDEHDADV